MSRRGGGPLHSFAAHARCALQILCRRWDQRRQLLVPVLVLLTDLRRHVLKLHRW
jgi:hypothetical protein